MLAALAACGGSAPSEYVTRDPCTPLAVTVSAATAGERDGIAGAVALWRARGVSAFDAMPAVVPDAPRAPGAIEIRFDDAAATFHGVFDPTADRVVINRDLADPATLAIVIAHELGHVFGLAHVAPATRLSLMNPGNLVMPPTDGDQRALEALWGICR
jgi:hypothetical protein